VSPDETHGDGSGTLGSESQPQPDASNKENRARLASTYRHRNMENTHVCNKVALSIRRRESRVSRSEPFLTESLLWILSYLTLA
jgi:hypothetical protein